MNKKLIIGIGITAILIILVALFGKYVGYDIGYEKAVRNVSDENTQDWRTLEMDGWLVKYPPRLKYCGDTEGIPFCIGNEQVFWFGKWSYRAPSEEEGFGSCGLNLDECKKFFAKDGNLSERIVNGLKGFEVIEDISKELTAEHLIFDNARDFYVEKPDKSGLVNIHQRKRSKELDDIYENILRTLKFGDYHFNFEPL